MSSRNGKAPIRYLIPFPVELGDEYIPPSEVYGGISHASVGPYPVLGTMPFLSRATNPIEVVPPVLRGPFLEAGRAIAVLAVINSRAKNEGESFFLRPPGGIALTFKADARGIPSLWSLQDESKLPPLQLIADVLRRPQVSVHFLQGRREADWGRFTIEARMLQGNLTQQFDMRFQPWFPAVPVPLRMRFILAEAIHRNWWVNWKLSEFELPTPR